MPEIGSPEEKKKILQQSIDALSSDFSHEKLKEVKALFKETSKTEADENRYLQELVKRFTRLLTELPFAKKFKKNGERGEASKATEKKSREISELLGKIMRSTE
jgi:formate-dependent nitrite reductase cytochrome c552 subunit